MNNGPERRKGYFLFRWKEYSVGYLFMLPWIIGFCVFVAFPISWSLFNSFHNVKISGEGFTYEWIGLNNYKRLLFEDNVYPLQIITYFQETLLMIPLILIFAFFVSLLLNQKFPGRGLMRAIFFLPVIFATGQVLMELFVQGAGKLPFIEQYDLATIVHNYFSERIANTVLDMLSKAVIILWYSGVQILLFIAGLQTIPRTAYEAIRIDGASVWESFWKITLPGMLPFIGLNAVFTIIDLFTFPFNPILKLVNTNTFSSGIGYASAMTWFYFALILLLLGVVLWITYYASRGRREFR